MMWTALAAVVSIAVFGLPLVLAVDRKARGGLLLGLSFLYGSGLVFAVLLALSLAGLRWSLLAVQVSLVAVSALALLFAIKRKPVPQETRPKRAFDLVATTVDGCTVATLLAFAAFAVAAPLWQWDFWAIWGLKGRVFFDAGGIDWRFLDSHWNDFSHRDYPLLLPLHFDYFALMSGRWDDRWLGLHAPAFAGSLLLIVRHEVREHFGARVAAVAALGACAFAITASVGMADGPLIAFVGAALLMLERARRGDAPAALHGAVLLGLAASTKNEGLAFLVAAGIALLVSSGVRQAMRLWPAVVIAAPWMIIRSMHGLATDVTSGPLLTRLQANFAHTADFAMLVTTVDARPVVVLVLLGALVAWRQLAHWRFTIVTIAIQFAFYLAIYAVTPNDLAWHIHTSWTRISGHLLLPLLVVVIQALAVRADLAEDARLCRSSTPPLTNSVPPVTS